MPVMTLNQQGDTTRGQTGTSVKNCNPRQEASSITAGFAEDAVANMRELPAPAAADALLAAAASVAAAGIAAVAAAVGTAAAAAAAGTGTAAAGCSVGCPADTGLAVWLLCAAPGTAQHQSLKLNNSTSFRIPKCS